MVLSDSLRTVSRFGVQMVGVDPVRGVDSYWLLEDRVWENGRFCRHGLAWFMVRPGSRRIVGALRMMPRMLRRKQGLLCLVPWFTLVLLWRLRFRMVCL